jgi:hypothetical protein
MVSNNRFSCYTKKNLVGSVEYECLLMLRNIIISVLKLEAYVEL